MDGFAKIPKLPKKLLEQSADRAKTSYVRTAGQVRRVGKSPDEALGELFHAVQSDRVYDDGKTFVDLVPRRRMNQIQQEYLLSRKDPTFDLQEFVSRHFYSFDPKKTTYHTNPSNSVRQHISELWDVLERRNRVDRGSLVSVPYKYVVPGGRFSEQFYWDSYFIMLGLAADKRWELLEGMMKNYAYMIRKFGYIPTANRTYFLSRSQPPFFSHMVKLLARHNGRKATLAQYLPYMLAEYRFWMKGSRKAHQYEHKSVGRVAEMPNGIILNRYYDNKKTPRPESLNEDLVTAAGVPLRDPERVYLHLRAGAESGWDFSSRWFDDPTSIESIHTVDIIPVDLNSLLYQLETTIGETYELLKQPELARRYMVAAERRAKAIQAYCWNPQAGFYEDYNFHKGKQTDRPSLASVFPLYARIASADQAKAVADRLEKDFLKEGGLVSTLENTGQQWDAPNGWAPLHWVAIQGLRNYGHYRLADEIKRRWIETCLSVFKTKGKLIEKYDVVSPSRLGGGGEYPLQDGFGWTNGVLAALLDES